jgi:hypothetical protein
MTNPIPNTSELGKCDACGKDFFDPFFIENEQDRKVAERFKTTLLDGTSVYAHGLCLRIASDLEYFFSQQYKCLVDISRLNLPEIDDAVDYATRSFYPGLVQKMNEVTFEKINDLATFFQHCEGKQYIRKRKRENEVEQNSSLSKKPRTKSITGNDPSLKPSQVLISFNSKTNLFNFTIIFNNGVEFENSVSLKNFHHEKVKEKVEYVLNDQKIPVIAEDQVFCTAKLIKYEHKSKRRCFIYFF